MDEQPTEKTCTKCGETKPLEEFQRHKSGVYGRTSACRSCISERRRSKGSEKSATVAKMCPFCKRHRPAELFDPAPGAPGGLGSMCQPCKTERADKEASAESKVCSTCGKDRPIVDYAYANRETGRRHGKCRDCFAEYQRAYRARPKSRKRKRELASTSRYREWYREYHRAYRKREYAREAKSQYMQEYRSRPEIRRREWGRSRWWDYIRRCRKYGHTPVIEDFTKADVIAKYGDHCAYCDTGAFEHLDHYVPVSKGGPHTLDNVRPACTGCNRAKSDDDPEEWLATQAELDAMTDEELDALIDAEIAKYLDADD